MKEIERMVLGYREEIEVRYSRLLKESEVKVDHLKAMNEFLEAELMEAKRP